MLSAIGIFTLLYGKINEIKTEFLFVDWLCRICKYREKEKDSY